MLRTGAFLVLAVVIALDQWSKAWARRALDVGQARPLVDGLLELRLTANEGALFGATAGVPHGPLQLTLVVVGLGLSAWLARLLAKATHERTVRRAVAMALALGGLAGNTLDRMRFSRVTDFLHVRFFDLVELGTINVADLALFAGLLLLIPELVGRQTPRSLPLRAGTTRS